MDNRTGLTLASTDDPKDLPQHWWADTDVLTDSTGEGTLDGYDWSPLGHGGILHILSSW